MSRDQQQKTPKGKKLSGYNIFMKTKMYELKTNTFMGGQDKMKTIAGMWNTLSTEEKTQWNNMAQQNAQKNTNDDLHQIKTKTAKLDSIRVYQSGNAITYFILTKNKLAIINKYYDDFLNDTFIDGFVTNNSIEEQMQGFTVQPIEITGDEKTKEIGTLRSIIESLIENQGESYYHLNVGDLSLTENDMKEIMQHF